MITTPFVEKDEMKLVDTRNGIHEPIDEVYFLVDGLWNQTRMELELRRFYGNWEKPNSTYFFEAFDDAVAYADKHCKAAIDAGGLFVVRAKIELANVHSLTTPPKSVIISKVV